MAGKGTGQLVRVAGVAGGAVGERILVSLAPVNYHMMADAAAVFAGGAGVVYLRPGLMQDVSLGLCAGGAVGISLRLLTRMRAPTATTPAIEAGRGGPALSTAIYQPATGTYGGGSRIPPHLRLISTR